MTIDEITRQWLKEKLGYRCTDAFIDWLDDIGYFKCPAAKSHHSNFKGGLFNHSMNVATELQRLTDRLDLEWERLESPYVIGLLHDICKTDDYKYDYDELPFPEIRFDPDNAGHGMKSIMILCSHFELTEEEKYCIAYHMGSYTDQSEWKYYGKAIEKYPNVLYTHMADMIASKIREVDTCISKTT